MDEMPVYYADNTAPRPHVVSLSDISPPLIYTMAFKLRLLMRHDISAPHNVLSRPSMMIYYAAHGELRKAR